MRERGLHGVHDLHGLIGQRGDDLFRLGDLRRARAKLANNLAQIGGHGLHGLPENILRGGHRNRDGQIAVRNG